MSTTMTLTLLNAPRRIWRARAQTAFAMMFVGALVVGAAGCTSSKDASTGPKNLNPVGEYDLETIQTEALPAMVHDGPIGDPGDEDYYESYVVTVMGGTMVIEDGGYYHMLVSYTAVWDDGVPYSLFYLETGTYETKGNRIL